MGGEIKVDYIKREFGHCVIDWEIENFGYAAHGMKYELKSPSFTVQPTQTSWRMALKTEKGLCDDMDMLFFLERMDLGLNIVWVNFEVSLIDQNGMKWSGSRGEYNFSYNDSNCSRVPNIYFGKVKFGIYNFNVMTLQCHMIVHDRKKPRHFELFVDRGLIDLALDLEQLCNNQKFGNVTLKLENGSQQTVAHKAILAARNSYLKNALGQDALPSLNCLSLDYNAMIQILKYMYTGDVVNVLENPSLSAFHCIKYLAIDELEDHYVADEKRLKSTIEVHQAGLMWSIENFSSRDEKCITSHLVFCDFLEMVWELCLYPRGIEGDNEFLTLTAENVEGKIDGDVWAKIEIFSDPYSRSWKSMNVVKEGELFEIRNFISRKSVSEKLKNGTLRIGFKACVSVGEIHSSYDQRIYPIPHFPIADYYTKLSKDILSLREDTRYTDVVLVAQGKEIKAHKCVLSLRSSLFSNLSDDLDEDKVLSIDKIRPEILEIVLDFIYSGVLKMFEYDIVFETYEAASVLGVNFLQREYSLFLCKNLKIENLFKIFSSARDHKDYMLKTEILTYMNLNLNVTEDDALKLIQSKISEICSVDEFLERKFELSLNSIEEDEPQVVPDLKD